VTTDLHLRIEAAARARYGPLRVDHLESLEGGHSGETWIAELKSQDGAPARVVVKSTPLGRTPVGRHDVLRQARAMRALRGSVAVPEVYFEEVTPPQFFGMQHIDGISTEPILQPPGSESAKSVAAVWDQAIELLAAVGAGDPGALELTLGEPVYTPGDELNRWRATSRAAGEELEARARPLADALAHTQPPLSRLALVHGDFRLGNTIRRDGRIRALIDWEIWSLGDPRTDLGWLVLFTDPEAFPGLGEEVKGTPEGAVVIERYAALGGDSRDADWFCGLACFKLAVIQAHNLRRHVDGRRHDPFHEGFGETTERLLELGAHHLART
jgi:aminoglycoside phosphotransferase (APT) family kinase protein